MNEISLLLVYHNRKKPSPRPALTTGSTLNDRQPRLHRALCSPHNNSHYQHPLPTTPVLLGYDPSSEMDPKSHTTIAIPTWKASSRFLIQRQLFRVLAAPPVGF
ncbi:hypothetical protein AVEN_36767-1 [Araneus ventricosus]|uniref:Uncharacterized protein n=1 Tax=Araneus ventricosus TaxID=182803 RepID=A0A4Y2M360_ARAVE|nr:hypothetical protein AVEN_36767-1 [Araneus ventricosus]